MSEKNYNSNEGISIVIEQMNKGFEIVNQMFSEMNQRFKEMNQKFEEVNQRFDKVDQKFEEVNKRFDEVNLRLDTHDEKLEEHDRKFEEMQRTLVIIEDQVTNKIPALFDGYNSNHELYEMLDKRVRELEEKENLNSVKLSILESKIG